MPTLSGVTTVATAGTAVALGDQVINGPIFLSVPNGNTGNMIVGNVNGDVASANGLEIAKGTRPIKVDFVRNLSDIVVDALNDGDKISWMVARFDQ